MEVEYFTDIETDAVYACLGVLGSDGIFKLRMPMAEGSAWEFLAPGSLAWDAAHQRIYRTHRVQSFDPAASPFPLPELPDIPDQGAKAAQWKEELLSELPIGASRYPRAKKALEAREDRTITLFAVLFEDTYESAFGDGEFHYLKEVLLTKEEADRLLSQAEEPWTRLHLRTVSIQLGPEGFSFPAFEAHRYDHHTPRELLAAFEARLRSGERSQKPHRSRLYASLARLYDPLFSAVFEPRLRLALRLAQPPPRARILDVGIGTGLSISHYPATAYVVGVDLSRPMLQLADSKVRRLHLTHLSLCQMDACRLAVADGSFNVVLSAFVASVVADRPAFFAELRRVCRPDGTICIVNHVHFRSQPLAWLEQRLEPLTRRLGWHGDLTLDDIVAGVGPGEISVHGLWPADPWPIVLCRRRPV